MLISDVWSDVVAARRNMTRLEVLSFSDLNFRLVSYNFTIEYIINSKHLKESIIVANIKISKHLINLFEVTSTKNWSKAV